MLINKNDTKYFYYLLTLMKNELVCIFKKYKTNKFKNDLIIIIFYIK